jgi:Heterokaryon incompatibility protein (HET)
MTKDFVYDSLYIPNDSIRLLQILPRSQTEKIHCRIDQFPALDCPSYCAVSYCWGEPDQPQMIILNDREFLIHQNLWWLLYHLRLANETRKLWIDAICIDQASVKERNHQVGLMGMIYERAETVLVWLGRESEDSRIAMDLLMNFPNSTKPVAIIRPPNPTIFSTGRSIFPGLTDDAYLKSPYLEKYDANNEASDEVEKQDDKNDEGWAALANLCRREYWYRTWIIQELLLASNIDLLCGDTKVSWKALEHIANVIPHKTMKMIESSGVIKAIKISNSLPFRFVEQRLKQQPASLRTLLHTYQDSQCIDPRDKVYAMLALASDCRAGEGIVADYSKDLCQVYMDVMQFCNDRSSQEGVSSSLLVLKILGITPNVATAFLNQQYKSGWLCSSDMIVIFVGIPLSAP